MRDQDKTEEQLISELEEMRQQIAELRAAETEREQVEKALDDEPDRSAFNLNILLLATFVVVLLGIIAMLSQIGKRSPSYMFSNTMFLIFAALILAVCYYLSRKGHVRAGSIIFTVMMTIACGGAIIVGGTRGALPVILIIPVVSASVTLGTNNSLALAALSVVALVIMGLLEHNSIIKVAYPAPEVMTLLNMFNVGFGLFFVTLGIWLAGYSLRQSLERARKEITERKRAEEAFRSSEEKFSKAFHSNPSVMAISTLGFGRYIDVNESFSRSTGYSREEVIGHTSTELELFASAEGRERLIQTLRERGSLHSAETSIRTKTGEVRIGLFSAEPVEIEGEQCLLTVMDDITERKQAEAALQESEQRFRTLVSEMLNGFALHEIICDETGKPHDYRFLEVNSAFEEMTGFRATDIVGKTVLQVMPQIESYWIDTYGEVALTGNPVRFENYSHELGKYFEVLAYSPQESQFATVFTDITDRKRAAEALRESEARFRALSGATFEGIAFIQQGTVIDANQQYADLLGYEMKEVLGLKVRKLVLPEDWELVQSRILSGSEEPYEHRSRHKDGSAIFVEARPRMVLIEGERVRVTAIRDITERERAEEEREQLLAQIRAQAQRMQHILDTVPEGVLLLDVDERIILVNPVAERDLVTLADAGTGAILTHLGDRPLVELLTSPPKGLWHEVTADERSFQVIARPIETGPTPAGWVLVIRDVTQQREIEKRIQQQERLAAIGQLAAGIAHDFNNIMASIVLYTQMTARMEGLPAIVQERMATINQQTGHATNLIQQILDFSRRAVLERRPLDLAILLKEHVRLLERTLPESIEIKLDCPPDMYTVNADPTRIQQMVTNLALNARDAMPGGGDLRVGLEHIEIRSGESPLLPEMEAGEWVKVTVSDTGTGIPPDALPHIFEPFFTTRAPLGSGLGLAQVHGIVGQHGGRIDVDTQVGRGTTFTIYLPVHPLEPPPDARSKGLPALATGQGETILVVEDNGIVREALVESLQLLNYEVLEATNGRRALTMLEEQGDGIDLLLSDVVMPGLGGVALVHALRERGLTVPVVLLTGHSLEKEMEDLRAQGMIDWLPKPPELEELAEVVASALNRGSD